MSDSCWYHPDREAFNYCDTCTRLVCEDDLKVLNKLVLDQEFIPHKSETIGYSLCPLCRLDLEIKQYRFSVISLVAKLILQFFMIIIFSLTFAFETPIIQFLYGGIVLIIWIFLFYQSFISPSQHLQPLRAKKQQILENPEIV